MRHRHSTALVSIIACVFVLLAGCERAPVPPERSRASEPAHVSLVMADEPANPDVTQAEGDAPDDEIGEAQEHRFRVIGMHCGGCANALRLKLAAVPGVRNCEASYDQSSATVVSADPEIVQRVMQVIADQGYEVYVLPPKSEPAESPEAGEPEENG